MSERIQKIIAARGVTSRRKAEELIASGRVTCNGAVCKLGDIADPMTDEILLDGIPLPSQQEHIYIMLNKPRGYVTTLSDEKGRKNAAQLVENCGIRVYPVGRLDMDSEGLLLFTNDGDLAQKLMHPSHEVNKTYVAAVTDCSARALKRLQEPMCLDGYRLRIPEVSMLGRDPINSRITKLRITIHEGRNRQVRRMCAIAGMQVKRLTRVAEGSIMLGSLETGKWRYLTEEEILALKQ